MTTPSVSLSVAPWDLSLNFDIPGINSIADAIFGDQDHSGFRVFVEVSPASQLQSRVGSSVGYISGKAPRSGEWH